MDLYYTHSSPYAKCVRMTIAELGIQSHINFIESHPFNNEPAFLQANPLGKVPCLIDDGEMILDSEVICDYLDANFTGGELFNPIYADWRLKTLLSMIAGLIDVSVARQMENLRRKEDAFLAFWWERQTTAITRTLTVLESRLHLMPENLTALQIYLMSALAYLDFRHSDINWREQHFELAKFFENWKSRECYVSTPLK